MFKALFTSATGMKGQQLLVDTISNNLANINTSGFKKSQVAFEDLLYEMLVTPGTEAAEGFEIPTGLQVGSGSKVTSTAKVFTQGAPINTGNQLDVAIQGKGFFRVSLPDGTYAYTRDGGFKLNSSGQLVNNEGYVISPGISIPTDATDVSIGIDGNVNVLVGSEGTMTNVGQLEMHDFINPAGLKAMGGNLYQETIASGTAISGTAGADGLGELMQGFLEGSNVDAVTELVGLILAQRAYEINSRAIRTSDEMLSTINGIT